MQRVETGRSGGGPRRRKVEGPRPAVLGTALAVVLFALCLWLPLASQGAPQATGHRAPVARDGLLAAVDPLSLSGVGRLGPGRLERILRQVANAPDTCLKAGSIDRRSAQKAELSRLFQTLSKSPLARLLMRRAGWSEVYVCADPATDLLGYYLAGLRLIGLNPHLSQGQKVAFLAHELSHVPQHDTYSDNRYFPPGDLILLRRVREAAAEALATRIAWQLRAAGHPEAWNEKAADRFYGDIARAFAAAHDTLPTPLGELIATRAAFDRWFAMPGRLDLYDRMTADHLRRISGDRMGLVSPRKALTHAFLAGIARLGGGDPLFSTMGRRLTDDYYRGQISVRNAALLECVLESAGARVDPLPPEPIT
ncbi:MAG: ImmA/IrrE family metallo-endopeptidase [Rhodospirillales bacterium]|nr:ImmA/IrrE family metallo-endopeptidase [Rhodospirillales bacterium]MDH3919561.1 ImmA/IrrE family metallo-endopeptidase [Rhodospirillales bacterium]